jgi:hypothetical protein
MESIVARSRILIGMGLVLLTAPSLHAEMRTWGQAKLSVGALHFGSLTGESGAIDDVDPETSDLALRFGADWGAWGMDLGLQYGDHDTAGTSTYGHDWGRQATLRLTYDLSPDMALGAVYGAGSAQPLDAARAQIDFYALEGAYGTGALQLGLQLGRFDALDADLTNAFHSGTFARLGAIYSLGSTGVIQADVGLFDGLQDSVPNHSMDGMTWSVEYTRQVGENPLAWSVGLDGGAFENADLGGGGDDGSFNTMRATVGLTAWFGDGDLSSAKRRGIFSQPDFGYVLDTGNLVD